MSENTKTTSSMSIFFYYIKKGNWLLTQVNCGQQEGFIYLVLKISIDRLNIILVSCLKSIDFELG